MARRRATVGHSQESLAEEMSVDVRTVRRWEAGDSEPLVYLRPKLAHNLQWTPEELDHALTAHETPAFSVDPGPEVDPAGSDDRLTQQYFDDSAGRASSLASETWDLCHGTSCLWASKYVFDRAAQA